MVYFFIKKLAKNKNTRHSRENRLAGVFIYGKNNKGSVIVVEFNDNVARNVFED